MSSYSSICTETEHLEDKFGPRGSVVLMWTETPRTKFSVYSTYFYFFCSYNLIIKVALNSKVELVLVLQSARPFTVQQPLDKLVFKVTTNCCVVLE